MNTRTLHLILSLGYLGVSWTLLLWLHFTTQPNLFAHFIAIPSLLLFSAYSAHQIIRRGV
ncbi:MULTISPECIES: hypothetical protein [Shewanella]|uniref:hypothetical protein n=1 Tax=Shewanella TaxID=22 RepID=UPI001EFEEB3B|nr:MULTISPECIES: hypothetical protein [Shewanella]MCG9748784.1 hypothetical protein [Shewanella sp. Isolate8]MCL2911978.1 hypothetical protein [Shewanella aquimarina]